MKQMHAKPKRSRTLQWGLAILVMAFVILTSVHALSSFYSPLPFYDTTSIIHFADAHPGFAGIYRYVLEEHNEHRIVFTKLLILIDFYWFGGMKYLPTLTIFVANTTLFLLIIARFHKAISPLLRPFWLVVLTALFLSLLQVRNFDSVFQLQFFLVNLFALFSFSSLVDGITRGNNTIPLTRNASKLDNSERQKVLFGVSLLWSFIAAFNMANGLFASLILVAFALLLYNSRYAMIAIVVAGFSWWLYFYGYTAPTGSGESAIKLHQIHQIVPFLIYFLGNIFNGLLPYHVEVTFFGTLGLFGTLYFTYWIARNFKRLRGIDYLTTMVLLFVLMAVGAASLQRLGRGDMELALVGRYSSLCVLFWAMLISWGFSILYRQDATLESSKQKRSWKRMLIYSCIVLALFSIFSRQLNLTQYMLKQGTQRELAKVSLQSDYIDSELSMVRAAWPAYDLRTLQVLREFKKSVFSTGAYTRLGTASNGDPSLESVADFHTISVYSLELSRHAFAEQFQLSIRGETPKKLELPERFHLLNSESEIIGYGSTTMNTLKHARTSEDKEPWIAFISGEKRFWNHDIYIPLKLENEQTYAKLDFREVRGLKLQHIFDLGTFEAIPFEIIKIHRKWMKSGYFDALDPIHPSEEIWGTWSPQLGDANTGTFTFRVNKVPKLEKNQRLVLPILVGPVRGACELSILESGEADAASWPIELGEMITDGWSYIDISDLVLCRDVIFKIEDKGFQWGQRVAFSMPVILNIE